MADVNAMKRRQMALWGPRNDKPNEETAPMTRQERLQNGNAVNDAFVDVFSNIIKKSPRTLTDSRHYSKNPKTQLISKVDEHAHATKDDDLTEYNHYHEGVKCQHNAHSVDERYRHTGVYGHDLRISTAIDKKELSPHSKMLRDEAFQRVCSGFTEGKPFARPSSTGRQPSNPTPSDKATVANCTSLISTSDDPKLENTTPMAVLPNPEPFSDLIELNQKSNGDCENPNSTQASPPKGKQLSDTPMQAESATLGINKNNASSTSSSIEQSEAVGADQEYIPPHLRALKGNVRASSASHGVLKPPSHETSLHSAAELAPSNTAFHEATSSGLPKLAPFNIPYREASLPNSTKPATSNTIEVSNRTLPPHLRSVKQQDIGVKPDPVPASSAASCTTFVSSKTLSTHLRTTKQEDVGIKPGNVSASSNFTNTTTAPGETLPPHLRKIKDQDVGVKSSPISTSSDFSSSSNARKLEASQKPVIPAFASKADVTIPTGKPDMNKPADAAPVKEENLEHTPFLGAWPKLAERDAAVSQVRKIIITKLPADSKPSFVASLVYGGPLEEITMIGVTTAAVMFLNPEDCARYNTATANGIVYGKDKSGRELVAFTEKSKDVNVIGGLLKGFIEAGVTRCIRCIGVEEDISVATLRKMAERKNRKLEGIEEIKTRGGARAVTFRFCKVADAVAFNGVLRRDEEFEQCNTMYCTDPCAVATDVHFDE